MLLSSLIGSIVAVQDSSKSIPGSITLLDNNTVDSPLIKPDKKKKKYRPPRDQSIHGRHSQKIVELLKKKGNGIRNYAAAKKEADEHIANFREKKGILNKKRTELIQMGFIEKRPKQIFPKGHHKKELRIERNMKALMKKDGSSTESNARDLAEAKYAQKNVMNVIRMREYRKIKKDKTKKGKLDKSVDKTHNLIEQ